MASSIVLSDNGVTSGSAGLKTGCAVYWLHLPEHVDMFTEGYVGVSIDLGKRYNAHKNTKENQHLYYAIKKYGFDNIIKQVLLVSEKSYCLDIERKLRPANNIGWNIVAGGGNPPAKPNKTSFAKGFTPWNKGVSMDDETKAKVSAGRKGKTAWNKGLAWSDEVKAKVSAAKKGIPRDPELVEKTAAFNRGKKRPEWVVQKIMAARKRNKELRALNKEVTQ